MLRATAFEYRHQTLLHQFVVGAAVLTYLLDPEDVVWRFVKNSAAPHLLERLGFLLAALFIAVGAILCTRARAYRASWTMNHPRYVRLSRQLYLGEISYAIGLGSLLPLAGFFFLVFGECLRVFRLSVREKHQKSGAALPPVENLQLTSPIDPPSPPQWASAFRQEATAWGVLLSIIVFAITLVDRHADILVVASFLIGLLLRAPVFDRRRA